MKTHIVDRLVALSAFVLTAAASQAQFVFHQINLVSDIPGLAAHTDAALVNPWGISSSASGPFWVSNAGTGVSKIYNTTGVPSALVVTIPGGGGAAGVPTGQVFNTAAGTGAFHSDLFLFGSETGTISGWRGALGTNAEVLVDNSATGAAYFGVGLGTVGANTYLYAANFGQGSVDVFDGSGAAVLPGTFVDPNLPAGYSPFNVQRLGSSVFVTYAQQDPSGEEIKGAGLGIVNQFSLQGAFMNRFATGGSLNAPWGLAIAPASFGPYAGNLLVGNFGDGTIIAFDLTNGSPNGPLLDHTLNPIVNDGLWGLRAGNGGQGGKADSLYFAAGLDDETHGLFGAIAPGVPDSGSTLGLLAIAGLGLLGMRRQLRRQASA